MGVVKSLVEGLDNSGEMEKAAKEAIEISMKMLNIRFKSFQSQLNIPIGQVQKIPAKYLICMRKQISVQVQKNSSKIQGSIDQIVETFANGKIAQGISKVLRSTLDLILGSYSAGYNENQDYVIVTNIIGGIYRIDYLVVQQKMQANGIQSRCSDVFGSYLIITSIDKKNIDDDNLYRVLVDRQFPLLTVREKFLLVKLTKGEELTADQMAEVQQITGLKSPPKEKDPEPDPKVKEDDGKQRWRKQLAKEEEHLKSLTKSQEDQKENLTQLGMLMAVSQAKIAYLKNLIGPTEPTDIKDKDPNQAQPQPKEKEKENGDKDSDRQPSAYKKKSSRIYTDKQDYEQQEKSDHYMRETTAEKRQDGRTKGRESNQGSLVRSTVLH